MVKIVCAPFIWKKSSFRGVKLILKMKLLKIYLNQCCITSIFSLINQNKLKILIKTPIKKLIIQRKGHVDKPSNDYDVDKMIKEQNDSFKQLNPDVDLRTRNTLPTLMNEFIGSSSNRTKVYPTDDILSTVNNNFVNTANNKFFNTVNKIFPKEIKSPSQLKEHEVNTKIADIDLIVNYSPKKTDRVISNTDNTSDEGVLSESYLENVMQEFKTLIANVEDFQNKNRENFDTNNITVPEHALENKFQIGLFPFLTLKYGKKKLC